ncbi:hypothetical protein UCDDA912_g10006 [Diaporthe ampelina]|uniref:Uncharacterized protein n=1 Tax=Diaporthe ampelina TaxID=1214573 RepID=A0A0G2F771_9PEZI|nr:hypothetical protein UCDDA912_g10006 [Diaporthe ampelina]
MGGIISKKGHLAGAEETGEGWESYLTPEEQEAVLHEAHLIRQGHQPECHHQRQGSAIFWAPVSRYHLRCKLAALLAALQEGADPNEEESEPRLVLRSGRPLDLCLDYTKADVADQSLLNNIPVIQMLLDHGADPRLDPIPPLKHLPACPVKPVEQARREAAAAKGPMKRFYEEAHRVLKKAADRLDWLDRLENVSSSDKSTLGLDGTEKGPRQT